MNIKECPPIKEILVRLARDWSESRNRYDRIDVGRIPISNNPNVDASTIEVLKTNVAIEFANHPFNRFVRWVCKRTAFSESELRNAALREFNRCARIASKLRALDENGTTTVLFRKLRKELPDRTARIFQPNCVGSEAAIPIAMDVLEESHDRFRERFGRPDASRSEKPEPTAYETIGTYKMRFVCPPCPKCNGKAKS